MEEVWAAAPSLLPGREKSGADLMPVRTPERLGVGMPGMEKAAVLKGRMEEEEEGAGLAGWPMTPPPEWIPGCEAICRRPGGLGFSLPGSTALTVPPVKTIMPEEEDSSLGLFPAVGPSTTQRLWWAAKSVERRLLEQLGQREISTAAAAASLAAEGSA